MIRINYANLCGYLSLIMIALHTTINQHYLLYFYHNYH
jgi:hypothetical protein